ncbi:monovalent cation:proton antiporter-2 (CPA2) family protein [Pararhodospirillum oryzae]|uniref:Potassium efflux system protein n=1 Tax=Pararhodospirillum oryzae TaxID=478448 RepID=A0A512H3Q6_9PROT|nr:monovalent cation:proton antiporter-2 (CPA2) family protein [Pararhodospirillum oryzae]GEO80094.1 potassium efflux system protein [Pararhodospirillum oryzae]
MMSTLGEAFLFMVAALVSVPLFRRLGLGSVLGYLTAGVVLGPQGLALVTDVDAILHFSELGVVLLLFLIGLELRPSRLWGLRKPVFGLGGLQVVGTAVPLAGLGIAVGLNWEAALVAGAGLALSSTAFCLQILAERGHLRTGYGRNAFAILLFQDLAVVPLLAVVPALAPGATGAFDLETALFDVGRAVGVIVAVIGLGRWVVRRMFRVVVGTGLPELFTAASLALVIGVSLLMTEAGLSMALGAFLAGMLLADSECRLELEATIEPFKGLLLGLFFIAVGMSVDLGQILTQPDTVAWLVLGLLTIKGLVLFALARGFGASTRSAASLAALMPQGGEFAFVLFTLAMTQGVLDRETGDLLLVGVTVSMAITPLLVSLNGALQNSIRPPTPVPEYDPIESSESRVILAGFGRFGQIVARTLRMAGIPFTALESDFDQIEFLRRRGTVVHYGDPSRPDLLRAAGIDQAEVFVIVVEDPEKALEIAEYVRRRHPRVRVLARARDRQHAYRLMEKGVYKVFRETYGSSLEMAEEIMRDLGHSEAVARRAVRLFRRHDERLLAEQFKIRHDEEALIASARAAAEELRSLFEQDASPEGGTGTPPLLGSSPLPSALPPVQQQGEVCSLPAQDASPDASRPSSQ